MEVGSEEAEESALLSQRQSGALSLMQLGEVSGDQPPSMPESDIDALLNWEFPDPSPPIHSDLDKEMEDQILQLWDLSIPPDHSDNSVTIQVLDNDTL